MRSNGFEEIDFEIRHEILCGVIEDFVAGKRSMTEVRYVRERLFGPEPNAWDNLVVPLARIISEDAREFISRHFSLSRPLKTLGL